MKLAHSWSMIAAMAIPFLPALALAKVPAPSDVKADTKEKFDGVIRCLEAAPSSALGTH